MINLQEGVHWLRSLNVINGQRIICLIDGEHYPPVTEWAVHAIEQNGGKVEAMIFMGGSEKIKDKIEHAFAGVNCPVYNCKNYETSSGLLEKAIQEQSPDIAIDLSDTPVMDYRKRFEAASVLLSKGISYLGADFIFRPPADYDVLNKPAISIIGTGKRVGKTAVSIKVSKTLKRHGINPAVIAMGRGGPSEPEVILNHSVNITPEYLLELADQGKHAASDYLENAALAGIPSIGCRRCGGGFAGNTFISNVIEGVQAANELPVDIVIMEGSGSSLPPVRTGGKIIVIGAGSPLRNISDYLDSYKLRIADLAVITMCEQPVSEISKLKTLQEKIEEVNPGIKTAFTIFKPEPGGDIKGKKIFLATTAPISAIEKIINHLEQTYRCNVTGYSTSLSNRQILEEDLKNGLSSAELLLTEIKAASIDLAVRMAKKLEMEIVFLNNDVSLIGGSVSDLDSAILDVCSKSYKLLETL